SIAPTTNRVATAARPPSVLDNTAIATPSRSLTPGSPLPDYDRGNRTSKLVRYLFFRQYPPCSLLHAKHHRRDLHLAEEGGAALPGERIAAPEIHIPVLVDVRGRPCFVDRQRTGRQRQRDQR